MKTVAIKVEQETTAKKKAVEMLLAQLKPTGNTSKRTKANATTQDEA